MQLKFAAQEHKLPGNNLKEKYDLLVSLGYQGLVLRSQGEFKFKERLDELLAAKKAGVIMPAACMDMRSFIGDFDADKRRDAIDNLKSQLSVMAQIEGYGVIIPASYAMHSNNMPPYSSPRSPEEDRQILLEGLRELGEHAKQEGTTLLLEPLNRYEDFMVNNLATAVSLLEEVNLPSVKITADLYHLSIEEDNIPDALRAAKKWIGWVDLSDSNRYQPGCGHNDWPGILQALEDIGYDNYLTLEGRIRGELTDALRDTVTFIRQQYEALAS
jgi:sugar phosphate isomerase/epimerase